MEQYIEDKKIVTVALLEEKTPNELEMVEVHFEDGTKEKMPKMRFELIVTEQKSDATSVRKNLIARISALCFGSFHEYGVKMGEVNEIVDGITGLVNNGFTKAQDIMWGVDYLGIPLIEVNNVLIKKHVGKQEDNNGSTSSGSGVDTENKE